MSKLDIVIFGATGFTGKHAVEEMVRLGHKYQGISWGIAGRSQDKLKKVLEEASKKTGEDLSSIRVIIADVGDEKSLKEMAGQCRLVANCCGPYRLYGEPVVRACIDQKAHYVDVSGEPQFIETMQLRYDDAAREAGVYVISACGFDSIPNDMGVVYLQKNFNGTLNSVESYISTSLPSNLRGEALKHGSIHYGTWESLVYSLANYHELKPLRKQLYPERLPNLQPKLKPRFVVHKRGDSWCLPFPGADNSIVYRTQRYRYEHVAPPSPRPAQFRAYIMLESLVTTLLLLLGAPVLYLLSQWSVTRNLLLSYPRVFSLGLVSHAGPPRAVSDGTLFRVSLVGSGWRGDVVGMPTDGAIAEVSGVNPGYGTTVTALLLSGLTVLQEQNTLPSTGGVLTTGAAFYNTSLIEKLQENNLKFKMISNTTAA